MQFLMIDISSTRVWVAEWCVFIGVHFTAARAMFIMGGVLGDGPKPTDLLDWRTTAKLI